MARPLHFHQLLLGHHRSQPFRWNPIPRSPEPSRQNEDRSYKDPAAFCIQRRRLSSNAGFGDCIRINQNHQQRWCVCLPFLLPRPESSLDMSCRSFQCHSNIICIPVRPCHMDADQSALLLPPDRRVCEHLGALRLQILRSTLQHDLPGGDFCTM